MHNTDDPNLPPAHLLQALRFDALRRGRPRRAKALEALEADGGGEEISLDDGELFIDPDPYMESMLRKAGLLPEPAPVGVDKFVEDLSDDTVAEIAAEFGVTPEEIRANPSAYIWDSRNSFISFELPRAGSAWPASEEAGEGKDQPE
jgi:hypothetical protein